MDPIARQTALAAAGAAGEATYVDDVFSTFLYDGNSSTQTITNNIDLSGEGGLVWIRTRAAGTARFVDTERGATKRISSNNDNAEATDSAGLTSFTSTGFTLGSAGDYNDNNDYVSWSFRKAPGFFDVVTYTGNGANRTIAHNLGSVPGSIWVKRTNASGEWQVYHRSLANTQYMVLNSASTKTTGATRWNSTTPTSTVFSLGTDATVNASGGTYVAYVFAHDDQSFGTDGDEAIIKCGTYNEPSSGSTTEIDLGFEPQWILWKKTDGGGNWYLFDTMRGLGVNGGGFGLFADGTNAEADYFGTTPYVAPTSTGFSAIGGYFGAGSNMIYIAIRRPHKPPEAGTDVFDDVAYTGNSSTQDISISPSIADSVLIKRRTAGDNWGWANRLTGSLQHLTPNSSAAEATRAAADAVEFDRQSAFGLVGNSSGEVNYSGATLISYSFKRAPGFFDVAAEEITGTSTNVRVNHNLGVLPELIIAKRRSGANNWYVYSSSLGRDKFLVPNTDAAVTTLANSWGTSDPTTTDFGWNAFWLGNGSHVYYLFATLDGISKVGTYSGTGSDVDVDCGFSAGARFVLIKRTDSTGDWYVWDTARGIVAGNDPYLELNTTDVEVTNTDYIDPLNSGFTVTSSAPAALNASGGTYIFLAIA